MLTGRMRGVYNNHGAVGTVTDAVRYVTEQKLFSTRHAKIADHQDIDCLLLSGADDRQCRVSINDDQGMTAVPGDLPRQVAEDGEGGDGDGARLGAQQAGDEGGQRQQGTAGKHDVTV